MCQAISSLETHFSSLVSSVREELTEGKIDVKDIRCHILSLPYKLKMELSHLIEEHAEDIQERSNVSKLFVYLDRTLWNFIDYSLLEHLVHMFGSSELNEDMQTYVGELSAFAKNTTISQLIQHWPGRKETPPTYCKLTLEVDLDPDECSLEKLNSMRKDFCRRFLPPLSELALLLCDFGKGSTVVMWFLAIDLPALIKSICNPGSAGFFEEYAVDTLHVRDVLVYPNSDWLGNSYTGEQFSGK